MSLEEYRALALERSPLVAEIDSRYASDVAQAYDTEVFRNPELQFEQVHTRMGLNGADDPQTNASLALPLRLSNFGAKSRVAALIRRAGDTQRKAALLGLTQRLVLQFNNLYYLQRSEELLGEAESRAARQVSLIHQGVSKGLLSEGDHYLFEGEMYRLRSQRAGVRAALEALRAEQAATLGTPCVIKAKAPVGLTALPSEQALIDSASRNELGDAARAALMTELSAEQLRLAELDAVPEFSPRLVYQHTNDGGDFVGAGISIPLPIFNRNQGARGRAAAELEVARRKGELLSAGGALEQRVSALRLAALSADEQARIFQHKVVPAFESALKSQERLYSQGKGSVLEVWQTLRTYNEARRESLSVWLAAASARAQLVSFVGEEL
jgi:cobalt-zinc-cadmium efflux system outer membrane protein